MRLSLGSVAVLAAALLIAFAFWPQPSPIQGPQTLFAQNQTKTGRLAIDTNKPASSKSTSLPHVKADHPLSSDVVDKINARFEQALNENVDFVIDPEPLKDAIDFICQRYQLPIIIDSKALEAASVDIKTQVKLPVAGIKLRSALKLILNQLPVRLTYLIDDEVMQITTVEKANERLFVVVYDCRDLVHLRPELPATEQRRQHDSGGIGGGMFADNPATPEKAKSAGNAAKPKQSAKSCERKQQPAGTGGALPISDTELERPLIRVIEYAGDVDDWQDEIGAERKITELGGLLIVRQTYSVHEQIKRILADLRYMRKEGPFSPADKEHAQPASAQGSFHFERDKLPSNR